MIRKTGNYWKNFIGTENEFKALIVSLGLNLEDFV